MKTKTILGIGAIVVLFFSCSKEVTELPPPTETGANTFGCKVNGEFWVPAGFGVVPTAPILEARFMPGRDFIINARNFSKSPTETEFEIFIKAVRDTGVYYLNTTVSYPTQASNYAYYVKRKVTPLNEWITSSQYTGSVTITRCDTINHIVSGMFQFNAINMYNDPASLTVTEGRFDVQTE